MHENSIWGSAPEKYLLPSEDVHLWMASLIEFVQDIDVFRPLLSPDEIQRANRYSFEKDRQNFMIARGILRILLGRYLNCNPQTIVFTYNSFGKPSLKDANPLQFNVSHSHEIVVYAFSYERALGIDVEYCRPNRNIELISRSFSSCEQEQLSQLSGAHQLKGFYQCWTRKEAFIKASGKGFSVPLKSFDVSVVKSLPRILRIDEDEVAAQEWFLLDVPVSVMYAGALAIKDHGWIPSYYRYNIGSSII